MAHFQVVEVSETARSKKTKFASVPSVSVDQLWDSSRNERLIKYVRVGQIEADFKMERGVSQASNGRAEFEEKGAEVEKESGPKYQTCGHMEVGDDDVGNDGLWVEENGDDGSGGCKTYNDIDDAGGGEDEENGEGREEEE